ncbi:MAG TPA: polyhydroxyalkanoate synthesis repressor PhaR [Burkholderiales bacterium]|nr:polyhydroxyalkanoate synthesis repressor PhaR [Burkholderiales bacterium]
MSATRIIKKYPNRRLYDTETSNYITLAEVKSLVLASVDFRVVDAKTNEDLTRSILLQIILDEESAHGIPMFTSEALAQIIRFYGNAMQSVMGSYLEKSIRSFIDMQQKWQEQTRALYGEAPKANADVWAQFFKNQPSVVPNPMGNMLEQGANMFLEMQEQMRKQAMSFFAGFPYPPGSNDGQPVGGGEPAKEPSADDVSVRPDNKRSNS